ncbi:Cytochrome c-552 [bacterium HR11]|nr:Cytochrome c-552 [bacterium HR11]
MKWVRLAWITWVLNGAVAWGEACFTVSGEVTYWASTLLNQWKGVNRSLYGELRPVAPETFQGWACVSMSDWDSGNATRDKHGRIMFEVEKYPEACYAIREARLKGTVGVVSGTMDIHGVRRPLSIEGRVESRGSDFRLKARFPTRISDWGMTPPRLMAVMNVRDEVQVEIDATLRPSPCGQVRHRPPSPGSMEAQKAAVFEAYCSFCHMPQGQGQGYYPPVTHVATFLRHPEGRAYLARVVMYGLFGPIEVSSKKYEGFFMPAFGELMDDSMLARVLNELLFALSRASPPGASPYTAEEVRRYRTPPATPADMWHFRQRIVRELSQTSP